MDAPNRIGLVSNGLGGWRLWSTDEPDTGGCDYPDAEYIIAAEHDRIVAEKDARITVMRKALLAFEQHEASHFRGPDAEKNRRQSYRGVKRAVRAALKGDSDE